MLTPRPTASLCQHHGTPLAYANTTAHRSLMPTPRPTTSPVSRQVSVDTSFRGYFVPHVSDVDNTPKPPDYAREAVLRAFVLSLRYVLHMR